MSAAVLQAPPTPLGSDLSRHFNSLNPINNLVETSTTPLPTIQ